MSLDFLDKFINEETQPKMPSSNTTNSNTAPTSSNLSFLDNFELTPKVSQDTKHEALVVNAQAPKVLEPGAEGFAEYTLRTMAKNVGQPILALGEAVTDYVGLTDDKTKYWEGQLQDTKQWLDKANTELGFNKDDWYTPDKVASFAAEMALPMAKGYKGVMAGEAILNSIRGVSERGKVGEPTEVLIDGITGAAIGVTGKWLGEAITKRAINRLPFGVDSHVYEFMKRKGYENKDIHVILRGVPKKHQAMYVANLMREDGVKLLENAADTDYAKLQLKRKASENAIKVNNMLPEEQVQGAVNAAKDNFSAMRQFIKESKVGVETNIDDLFSNVSTSTPLGTKGTAIDDEINSIKQSILDKGNVVSADDLLETRQILNDRLSDAKGKDKTNLLNLKRNIDNLLSDPTKVPEEYAEIMQKTISQYNESLQNLELRKILDKTTDIMKVTINDNGVDKLVELPGRTNYAKALENIESASINTPDAKEIVKTLEEFDKKFALDYMSKLNAQGANTKGGALGFWGQILKYGKEKIGRYFGEYGNNIEIQLQMRKEIKNSKKPADFFVNIATNKNIPQKVRNDFVKILEDAKAADFTDYTVAEVKEISSKLTKEARKKNLALRQIEINLEAQIEKLNNLNSLKRSALTHGDEGNIAIENLDAQIKLVKKRIGLNQAKYDDLKESYDGLNTTVENIKGFGNLSKGSKPIKVTPKNYEEVIINGGGGD